MNSNIKGITIELNGDSTNLKQGFSDVEAKARDTGQQLKLINQQLKLDPGNLDLAAQKLQLLRDQSENASAKLERLRSVQDQIAEQYRRGVIDESQWVAFQQELAKTEIQLQRTENQIGKIAGASDDVKTSQDGAAQSSNNWADVLKGNLLSTAITKGFEKLVDIAKQAAEEFKELAVNAAATGDTIDKQSQRLGMSMDAYQEWSYILSQNGADISTLTGGMRKLTDVMDNARSGSDSAVQALSRVGLSVNDLNKLSGEQQFSAVVKALQQMDNESERNAAANDLLGRSYTDLIPLLNQSADSVEQLRQRAHDTGQLMSGEGVAAAVAYTDATDTLNRALEGVKNRMGGDMLQALADIKNGITDVINGTEGGADEIEEGFNDLFDSIETAAEDAFDVIDTVVTFAGDRGPDIIKAAAEKIKADAPALSKKVAEGFKDVLTAAMPEIGTFAGEVGVGIGSAAAEALINAPEIIEKFGEAGVNFCNALADGIVNFDWTDSTQRFFDNVAKALEEGLHFLEPVHKNIMLFFDNIRGALFGDSLYGGDINNIDLSGTYSGIVDNFRDGAEIIVEGVDAVSTSVQTAYNSGKEILGIAAEEFEEEVAEDISAGAEEVEESGEEMAKTIAETTAAITEADKKAQKEREKAEKERQREEEKARKQAEKDAEAARKSAAKNVEKEIDEIYDAYEKKYKELQKLKDAAYKKFMSIGGDVFTFTKDKDGNTTSTIEDMKKQMKDMKSFYDDVKKLKDSGASQEMISELLSMDNEKAIEFADYLSDMDKAEFDNINALYKQKEAYARELSDMLYADDEKALDKGLSKALGDYYDGSADAQAYADDFIAALKSRDSDFHKAFAEVIGGNIQSLISGVKLPDAKSVAVPVTAAAPTQNASATASVTSTQQTVTATDNTTRLLSAIYELLVEISGKLDGSTAVKVTVTPDINKIAKEVSAVMERDKRIKST